MKGFLVIFVVLVLTLASYKAYFMLMPEIVISNLSGFFIKSVSIQLPNNKIVFDDIAPNSSNTIFYSLNQSDGTYKYKITFESGEIISDECGYVTDNEIGKVFHITIKSMNKVECSDNEA